MKTEELLSFASAVVVESAQIGDRLWHAKKLARGVLEVWRAEKPCGWTNHDIVSPIDIAGNVVALTVREFTVTNRDELDWAIAELLRKRDLLEES